jgi:hypothetical protein
METVAQAVTEMEAAEFRLGCLNKAFNQGAAMDTLHMVWGESLVGALFPY